MPVFIMLGVVRCESWQSREKCRKRRLRGLREFEIIWGHWIWHQSNGHIRHISDNSTFGCILHAFRVTAT